MSRKKRKHQHQLANSSGTTPIPNPNREFLTRVGLSVEQFSGPLPPPAVLAKYNDIEPGFANRIMTLAEAQAHHRQELETLVVRTRVRYEGRAQILAAAIAIILGVGAIWLVSIGKSIEGVSTIIGELAAFTGVFMYGRKRQEKELDKKKQALAGSG